jgi:hypothetical protein
MDLTSELLRSNWLHSISHLHSHQQNFNSGLIDQSAAAVVFMSRKVAPINTTHQGSVKVFG